ncbi:MAG TPA: aminotransferase class I/II-fold pyridoxal phosphate-dependent enzyme [Chitinophagaceae bacterium]|nr:aminotransferase class I/II-fold pyridoxal phosphate-dependent enzyme [Chitinophagaceae bacterium]
MSYFEFDTLPGRTSAVRGKEYLFFSGYAYLGMQYVDEFRALVKEGMDKYGWLFPSSRISNTRIHLFEECEQLLSSITQCDDTVLVSSGYTAGRLATGMFEHDIVNLRPSHPAIKRNNTDKGKGIYAVDTIDILTSSVTNIDDINKNYATQTLVIDDSHGAGLTGKDGTGAGSYVSRKKGTDYIFTYSLSKAWGINAGAISCPQQLAAKYRTLPAYTGATAPSPALLYAFIKGQAIYKTQREKLKENIRHFQAAAEQIQGILHHEALPIFVLPSTIDENALAKENIIISSFAYPDPSGPKIQRVVINALHTKNDIEYLAERLYKLI